MNRINRTRFAVLGMLSTGERSGYDLKEAFGKRMSHFWAESAGQIYPTLKSLSDEGLVRAALAPGTGRRRRTVYSLTDSGRRELRDWLHRPPQREQVRHELLLKLYFGAELGVDTALAHVGKYEQAQRAYLELLDQFELEIEETAESEEQELFLKITLSSGRHVIRARIAWCEESRRRLKRWRARSDSDSTTDPKEEIAS